MNKKLLVIISCTVTFFTALLLLFYLLVLPFIVSNNYIVNFIEKEAKNIIGVDLVLNSPILKSGFFLPPVIKILRFNA